MDPDSKAGHALRAAPWLLAGLIILVCGALCFFQKLDGKDMVNIVLSTLAAVMGARQMMSVPAASSTTKETTDPSGTTIKETKVTTPLGIPAPASSPTPPTGGQTP